MDVLNRNIERLVYITDRAAGFVQVPPEDQYRLERGQGPGELERLLGAGNGVARHTVIFAGFDEYGQLDDMLSRYPFVDLSYRFILFGTEKEIEGFDIAHYHSIAGVRTSPLSAAECRITLRTTMLSIEELYTSKVMQQQYLNALNDTRKDQVDLIDIGRALSTEKDQNNLLRMILKLSKRITGADAGSIYLVEEDEAGNKRLRFKYSHTFSRTIPLEEFVMVMDKKSIAGYVAVTGEVLNIPNAYDLPDAAPYSYNSSFDKKNNYICRSMLVVPMRNHVDEIIGVIQLINSKENIDNRPDMEDEAFSIRLERPEDFDKYVVTFNEKYNSLLEAVAGQAAIAIENNRMIEQIQNQFEEFVKASVTAIESRDPATSGHSFRVAAICKEMARAINESKAGELGPVTFSENDIRELEYAALLHDFGKVYIDLAVFKKAKKLYPKDLENLILRLDYLYRFLELQYSMRETELLHRLAKEDAPDAVEGLLEERHESLSRIREIRDSIVALNEPSVVAENIEEKLNNLCSEIGQIGCVSVDGDHMEVISDNDRENLKIKRGSLNETERKEIESHVVHTYTFVSKIPWPPEYRRIPEIALRHHEKLDGTGYPDGIKGKDGMLIQSRIMAVADIYDALVASDRPYKKAMPMEKVITILKEEANRNILDKDLVDLFIEKRIYEKVSKDSFKDIQNGGRN
ncbi:MAG: HD domain-containing protein [Spirochaetes bacterium]|nr:HD domain-containing protein [Spirochaetota bacterium]